MTGLTKRVASLGDVQGIWGLFRQAADDIPFDLGSEAAQESILSELMACCTSGLSPVVVDDDKAIIGALLVRRDDFEWASAIAKRFTLRMRQSRRAIGTRAYCARCLLKFSSGKRQSWQASRAGIRLAFLLHSRSWASRMSARQPVAGAICTSGSRNWPTDGGVNSGGQSFRARALRVIAFRRRSPLVRQALVF